jgi:hypothetical protein
MFPAIQAGLMGRQAYTHGRESVDKFRSGDVLGGLMSAGSAVANGLSAKGKSGGEVTLWDARPVPGR